MRRGADIGALLFLLLGLAARAPEVFVSAGALDSVELLIALMCQCDGQFFHLRDFQMLDLMPGIDEAAVDEKAGFRPALGERFNLALYILLMLDGQQVKGFAAGQMCALMRDEQHLRVVIVCCFGFVRHCSLLWVPPLRMALRWEAMRADCQPMPMPWAAERDAIKSCGILLTPI
jgi:hypothetical protein